MASMDAEFYKLVGQLIRESEQLRIIKNFVDIEDVYSKEQIKALIKAMEVEQ